MKPFPGNQDRRKGLARRHGRECWYCGRDDYSRRGPLCCTLEHLMNRDHPEANAPENLRLAHAVCNGYAGNLSLEHKLQLRYLMRNDPTVRDKLLTKAGAKALRRKRERMKNGVASKKKRQAYRRPRPEPDMSQAA